MRLRFKINVALLNTISVSENFNVTWNDVTDLTNVSSLWQEEDEIYLEFASGTILFGMGYASGGGQSYTSNFDRLSEDGTYIQFVGIPNKPASIEKLINLGIVEVTSDETLLYVYKQNSKNNVLSKNLTFVDIISGQFNHAIGLKNIDIDIHNYGNDYNYIYIPLFKRYYYINSVELISNDVTRLHLKEDVLMSWSSLIKQQLAYVERQQNDYDDDLIDELVSYSYDKNIVPSLIPMTNNIYENVSNTDLNFVIESVGG